MYIYLDHNILDDISKDRLSLKPSDKCIWIYSNENLAEIRRSGDDRFLDVLKDIDARLIELVLDNQFRITNEANIHPSNNPYEVYNNYVETVGLSDDGILFHDFIGRLFGADNKNEIVSLPDRFEQVIEELLEPDGLYSTEIKDTVGKVSSDLRILVEGDLQNIGSLENSRSAIGTHDGRASQTEKYDNPLKILWDKIRVEFTHKISSDQFYGFNPIDKQGYDEWPMYLGIVGCHMVLNFIGYRPDKGLFRLDDLSRILSDGAHIAFGAYCHGLLSQDKRLRAKANAIYKYQNIPTVLLSWQKRG